MTITLGQLAIYAGALFGLFLTPGPVWVALTARAMSGGFKAAWPLALGVVVGDFFWPLLAIWGVSVLSDVWEGVLFFLRLIGAGMFVLLGIALIRSGGEIAAASGALTRPGMWAGFVAGLAVILGNPKAILFYLGLLPGFFDLSSLTVIDIAAICVVSALVPLVGNLALAAWFDQARQFLSSPQAVRRLNSIAGVMLIGVGAAIIFL